MELLEKLNIPLCQLQRIPVKTLIEQLQPNSNDKKLIESHIASMHLVSILNEQTIRIRAYKDENYSYQSIYVFQIELKKNDSIVSLSNLIHSAFPEPTILVFNRLETNYISLATKRINKIEQGKTVVEDVLVSKISKDATEEQLSLSKIKGFNLREYYLNIIQWLYRLKVLSITKVYPQKDLNFKFILKQYEQLNADINRLKEKYKQASMKSEKIRIDDELFDKEMELKLIIKQLQ